MKWFKHFTNNSTQNQELARILSKFGVEGYGRYFLLVENLVGATEDLGNVPSTTYSVNNWASILHCKPKKVGSFLEYLANVQLIKLQCFENEFVPLFC